MQNKISIFILSLILLGIFSILSHSDARDRRRGRRVKINCKERVDAKKRKLRRKCSNAVDREGCYKKGKRRLRKMRKDCRRCNRKYKNTRRNVKERCTSTNNKRKCYKARMRPAKRSYKRCLKRAKIIRTKRRNY